jgi:hypothetical protein
VAVLAVLVLVAAACADRGDDAGVGGDDGAATTAAGGGDDSFGTLASPCGPGDESAGKAGQDGGGGEGETQGITDDSIAVGTIADPGFSGAPGLNQEIFDAGQAFVAWCNEQGGINGRQLDLTEYDAAITEYQARIEEACTQEFAIVGDGAVQDNLWSTLGRGCGLIDIAGFAVTPEKAGTTGEDVTEETRVVQPLPNPSNLYPTGAFRLVEEEFPEAIDRVGIIFGDFGTTIVQKDRIVEAIEAEGGTVVYEQATNIQGEANWAPFAAAIRDAEVEWLTVVGAGEATGQLQQALVEIDYQPTVTVLETNFYDPIYLDAAGPAAEGTLIRMAFTPFEEADGNPATQRYIELVEAIDGKVALLGAQSMSAWLLFAQSAKECDDAGDLTRTCVLETAGSVQEWDGGGLHAPADPSTNTGPVCVMLLEIQDGEFVRHAPDEGFECDEEAVVELEGDYSTSPG